FQAEDGIRDPLVTGVQTCALPIYKQSSQNSNVKTEFGWKDGVSVSDIPDFPIKGSINGKEVTFLYINFEKWRGPNDNVINFSLKIGRASCRERVYITVCDRIRY